ncbi:MAG: choice-of-anchor J domain-containing protein [Bacteroidales bacterium]|nr:choice-of-anchor J domain-containing protein [Bacteroidales bacterium]
MKKTTLLITVLLMAMGMAQAQDVYFSGNGNNIGKIWKNDTLIYSISDTAMVMLTDMKVANDSTIYSAGYNYSNFRGHVWLNDSVLFMTDTPTFIERMMLNDNGWTAVGENKVWQNGEILYEYSIDSNTVCNLNALALDDLTGDIYAGGSIVTPGVYACVWKNDTILWQCAGWSEINDLYFDGDNLYAAGFVYGAESIDGVVWQNDSIIFQIEGGDITEITAYNGSLYWAGVSVSDNMAYIWQDGEVLYSHADANITALYVNEYGVFYAGIDDDIATVWKDGEVLYEPEDCESITAIAVLPTETPQPGPEPKLLPWFDGFESDSTWADWTILDFDGNTAIGWERNDDEAATDDYSARHLAFDNIQEGWLITPPLYLHPYSDSAWMSFKTMEVNPNNYTSSQLMISTTGTELSDFTEIWSQENPSNTWDSIHIDLTEYQGDTIYLAFKYSGHHGHDWYLDDINVEEALTLFTITVEPDSTGWGTTTGSGSYPYGGTVTIEAIPNTGHTFLTWSDGNMNNPRTIVVTQDSTFIAHFGTLQYTIEVVADHPEWGTVTGGGTYYYGDTIQISATPNTGFAFDGWDDGITDNPRTIIVAQDSLFTAMFSTLQHTVTVVSDHPAWGSVAGGGTYYYGDTIQISATANLGFQFNGWDDGNNDNPRTVIVEEDITFTAHFGIQQCLIKTEVTPDGAGSVNGGGTYDYGTTIHLTAHSNTGYVYSMWDDGVMDNPRSVFVEGNATYTAVFTPLQYEITTECDPVEGGSVTGAGTYDYGSTAVLTATPNNNYIFLCWSDGIASNPRNVTVTGNANYKALFHLNGTPQYTINVLANDPELGTVTGSGTYPEGTTIDISATPNTGAYFTGWDDGNTDNPRSVTVTQDMTFTAIFTEVQMFTITVRPEFPLLGSTYGGGTYPVNTVINIGATPNPNFYFSGWQDGNMDNPRSITVTEDAEYIASFSQDPVQTYTVTVYYDENQGFILGAGSYMAGATASIAAIAADGFVFKKWNDDTTDNPKVVVVDHDIFLAAFFESNDVTESGFDHLRLYPNPANDKIHIEGFEGEHEIFIYNTTGSLVKTATITDSQEIGIGDLPAGLYLVRIDQLRAFRFIKK